METIEPLSDEKFIAPMHGWSPKGVASHLAGWNDLMIEAALSILAGQPPAYYEDAPNNYSNINASSVAKYVSHSKAELVTELGASMERLEAFVRALPQAELTANHNVYHYKGSPATVKQVIESLASDYQAHTREIQA